MEPQVEPQMKPKLRWQDGVTAILIHGAADDATCVFRISDRYATSIGTICICFGGYLIAGLRGYITQYPSGWYCLTANGLRQRDQRLK